MRNVNIDRSVKLNTCRSGVQTSRKNANKSKMKSWMHLMEGEMDLAALSANLHRTPMGLHQDRNNGSTSSYTGLFINQESTLGK